MDGPGAIVPVAVAAVGAVCGGWGGGNPRRVLLEDGRYCVFPKEPPGGREQSESGGQGRD